MNLSVVICTFNPRRDYLCRVLSALKRQTLPMVEWELLLIDNASNTPLNETYDLSWHCSARLIREEELGLTPARLRGIREARGDLLVFVDDDNILSDNYLESVLIVSKSNPRLGAFNGSLIPEFEIDPPIWSLNYLGLLALGELEGDCWGYGPGLSAKGFAPCGAGLVVLKEVAQHYSNLVSAGGQRSRLDRRGMSLTSGGDTDLAMCACSIGYSVGRFKELVLKHLIPKERLSWDYMLRLIEGMGYSHEILRFLWDEPLTELPISRGRIQAVMDYYIDWRWKMSMNSDAYLRFKFKLLADRSECKGIEKAQQQILEE